MAQATSAPAPAQPISRRRVCPLRRECGMGENVPERIYNPGEYVPRFAERLPLAQSRQVFVQNQVVHHIHTRRARTAPESSHDGEGSDYRYSPSHHLRLPPHLSLRAKCNTYVRGRSSIAPWNASLPAERPQNGAVRGAVADSSRERETAAGLESARGIYRHAIADEGAPFACSPPRPPSSGRMTRAAASFRGALSQRGVVFDWVVGEGGIRRPRNAGAWAMLDLGYGGSQIRRIGVASEAYTVCVSPGRARRVAKPGEDLSINE
ncbi:hypothetical protein C8J57DRAFT_1250500 [Mycena rebaudengoi]|nr:hypothetical protein C8J57DRAFT_1250500 [Mycena rebaudengoi]